MQNQKPATVVVRRTKKWNEITPLGRKSAQEICEALPELDAWGFRGIYSDHSNKKHAELRAELLSYACADYSTNPCVKPGALRNLLRWLEAFEPSERWTASSSYSLKHTFERETGVYVPDGLFILGALMAGFTARFGDHAHSAHFKMRRPGVR